MVEDQVQFVHVGDWEPDARLNRRGRSYCEPVFDAFEDLFSLFLQEPPHLFLFTGDFANNALNIETRLNQDRLWARTRFERLFDILASMHRDSGTRCYWTIASHEWHAFKAGQWPFSLSSVASTFCYFACPSGNVDHVVDLGIWVLGFGNLGGDKSRAGHPNAKSYKEAIATVWSNSESRPLDMGRTCIISASDVMQGLQTLGAAYVGFGGLQTTSSGRRRPRPGLGILGRPYSADDDGTLLAFDYVRGVVGGEVDFVDAPLAARP